jgi:hypothetical protein
MDRPAEILKVWPTRAPVERLRPTEFNTMIEQLAGGALSVSVPLLAGSSPSEPVHPVQFL